MHEDWSLSAAATSWKPSLLGQVQSRSRQLAALQGMLANKPALCSGTLALHRSFECVNGSSVFSSQTAEKRLVLAATVSKTALQICILQQHCSRIRKSPLLKVPWQQFH